MSTLFCICSLVADGKEEQQSSIPPFNINAETAADVYKLDDSIRLNVLFNCFFTVKFTVQMS